MLPRYLTNRTLSFITLTLAVTALVGCGGPAAQLNRDAAALIKKRQHMALGEQTNDPNIVPDERDALSVESDEPYASKPATRNPDAEDLPASRRLVTPDFMEEGAELPRMLDPVEDSLELDLQDVLAYAIANSRDYRNEKEELFISALSLLIERHLWGPRFFNDFTATFSGTPERGDYDQVSELVNEFRVTHRLPYGGEVSVGALVNLVNVLHSQESGGRSPKQEQDTELVVGMTIPLLRGAGQVAREDLIQAERDLIYATRFFERFRREFFVAVSTDYFGLIASAEGLRNQERALGALEESAERFQRLAEAGRVPFFDAEQSEVQAISARNDLLSAQERYAFALDQFKIRIGMPIEQRLVLKPTEVTVPHPLLKEVDSIQTAYQYRLDLQTTSDLIDDSFRRTRVAKNALLPDLDLFADLSLPTDPDKDEGGVDFDLGSAAYATGFRFGAPLDRRVEWIQYRQSLIALERSRRSFTLARDQVGLQVRSSIRRIQRAELTLRLQERGVELAERRQQGVLLNQAEQEPRDIIDAATDLLDAENDRDDAARDLRISILNYLLDTGQMRIGPDGRWLPPGALVAIDAPPLVEPQEENAAEVEDLPGG